MEIENRIIRNSLNEIYELENLMHFISGSNVEICVKKEIVSFSGCFSLKRKMKLKNNTLKNIIYKIIQENYEQIEKIKNKGE